MKGHHPARATAVITGLFLAGLVSGSAAGVAAVARAQDPYEGLELFARALTTIQNDYVEEVDTKALVDAAIDGMVDSLDEHSHWLSTSQMRSLQEDTDGAYDGIGVEVKAAEDGVVITKILPGSPALREGLSAGDRILKVNGKDLAGLSIRSVHEEFEGPRGTEAVLTVVRTGWTGPKEIPTLRDEVHVPAVEGAFLAPGLAYIRLVQFQNEAAKETEEELGKLLIKAPIQGLILDLRDNTGGLLDEAVGVTDLFLDEGPIVSTRGRTEAPKDFEATPGGLDPTVPIVVLVNGLSASASEIVAAALQDAGRARLVGTRTYGKGSVQSLYRNPDDSALKLTIARYYTRSGKTIDDHEGRIPEVEVPFEVAGPARDLEDRLARSELPSDEKAAMLELLAKVAHDPHTPATIAWDTPATERLKSDPQMEAALAELSALVAGARDGSGRAPGKP